MYCVQISDEIKIYALKDFFADIGIISLSRILSSILVALADTVEYIEN